MRVWTAQPGFTFNIAGLRIRLETAVALDRDTNHEYYFLPSFVYVK